VIVSGPPIIGPNGIGIDGTVCWIMPRPAATDAFDADLF
jgi:hypothetical protein